STLHKRIPLGCDGERTCDVSSSTLRCAAGMPNVVIWMHVHASEKNPTTLEANAKLSKVELAYGQHLVVSSIGKAAQRRLHQSTFRTSQKFAGSALVDASGLRSILGSRRSRPFCSRLTPARIFTKNARPATSWRREP